VNSTYDTDVLVVGAGPSGLTLAASLVKRGIATTVVDRQSAGANTSRAAVVNARSLEVLEGLDVARRLVNWDVRLLAADPYVPTAHAKALGATLVDLPALLAESDVVSLHASLTDETRGLIGEKELRRMKPTALLVNTARGEVIDENALARMIENNELAGAGLDVFEHEPAVNPKLLKSNKVVVLPHMGSATLEGRVDMGEKVIINIKTFLDGHAPPDRVHPAMF